MYSLTLDLPPPNLCLSPTYQTRITLILTKPGVGLRISRTLGAGLVQAASPPNLKSCLIPQTFEAANRYRILATSPRSVKLEVVTCLSLNRLRT